MPLNTEVRPKLLIAEDDRDLAETMREALEEDFAVEVATDGNAAVLRATDDRPDVVLVDLDPGKLEPAAASVRQSRRAVSACPA